MRGVELYDYDESNLNDARVMIFGNENFALPFSGTFTRGEYTTADLEANHIGAPGNSFAAQSIKVPDGLIAYLYKEDQFEGDELVLTGPITVDFNDEHKDFKQNVGSLKVTRVIEGGFELTGRWDNYGSSPNEYTLTFNQDLYTGSTEAKSELSIIAGEDG